MNLPKTLTILLLLLYTQLIVAQQAKGDIVGKVVTSDNTPAVFINVTIKSIQAGVITNAEGGYELKNIPYGNYTLEFSLIGMEKKSVNIQVNAPKIRVDNIVLKENEEELDEVVIIAQRLNQFAQKETPYVSRLPLKNINTPQSYTVVSNALMKEQIITDLPSAFKSITGGGYVEANQGYVTVYARGFRADSRIKNGLHTRIFTPIAPQNIQSVEVIKGPSAITYGSGFYGGLVNLTTKKPLKEDKLSFSYNIGNWDLHRLTADYNKAINNKIQFRLNSSVHTENAFQTEGSGHTRNFFVAPAVTYNVSDKLEINLQAEFYSSDRNLTFARATGRTINASTWDEINWNYRNNYSSKDFTADMNSYLTQLNVDYKFLDNWTSKTAFSYADSQVKGSYLRIVALSKDEIQRQARFFDPLKNGNIEIRQDFIGEYNFSNIKNKTLVGIDYLDTHLDYTTKMGVVNGRPFPFLIIDRVNLQNGTNVPNITSEQVAALPGRTINLETRNENLAFYASNAITFNDKVTILGGIRYDNFNNKAATINGNTNASSFGRNSAYEQGKVSYNAGIAINPFNDKVAFFGNYMNGFRNVAPDLGNPAGDIVTFDPEEVKQWETGIKLDLLNGKIKSTISYYDIKIDNGILNRRVGNAVFNTQDGKISSKGVEVDIIANPFKGFNVVAGYTYNDLKNINAVSPAFQGKRLPLSPETIANVWASYRFTRNKLKGLGFGFGVNHVSKIYAPFNFQNTFWAKPYTTLDGTVFYQKDNYRIGVKLNNISNQEYYNAYGVPQKTFNAVLGLTYNVF